ncbi:hypothetical protein BPOR_1274g00010 [Botrytis porri]|uniref:Uncharacterized protein n=1 Tax=Botrytis porri TaxID=87229 RepID=A0A4Z1K5L1_9HELO|nr:hypothetical protein BPOR_1274g00010 [Botrytis porri]
MKVSENQAVIGRRIRKINIISITISLQLLQQLAAQKKNLFACHHHARRQQQYKHHHYDNAFAIASTSASTTSRSTRGSDQGSTFERVIFNPRSQEEQLAGVGSCMEEYDDNYGGYGGYGGIYPQGMKLRDREAKGEGKR